MEVKKKERKEGRKKKAVARGERSRWPAISNITAISGMLPVPPGHQHSNVSTHPQKRRFA